MQTKAADWFLKDNSARAFFITLLLLCLTYRGDFLAQVYSQPLISNGAAFSCLALGLLDDIAVGVCGVFLVMMVQAGFYFGLRGGHEALLEKLILPGKILLGVLLGLIAIILLAQQKVFFTLFTGLSFSLLSNSLVQGFTPVEYLHFMGVADVAFIALPVVIFILLNRCRAVALLPVILSLMLVMFGLGGYFLDYTGNIFYFKILFQNPLHSIAQSLLPNHNYYTARLDKPASQQLRSVRLIDASFVKQMPVAAPLMPVSQPKWNVVYVIMESVGLPYVFDTLGHNAVPMPFLKKLSAQGLWLNNNYSAGNTSVLGVFGLMTGIYPSALSENFEMQTNIHVPTLAGWLGKHYDSFFVMADDSSYFFQKNIIANTGFKKFYDAADIGGDATTNEVRAVDFFLGKVAAAKTPFLAVYWSNATHWPYPDYGADERLFADTNDRLARYYNNLHLVDKQIQRIYAYLAAHQLLANTILVIVGDHGEGFGFRYADRFHGLAVYQDQIQVPVLIYQPRLFKPQWVSAVTSSVDILPTLFTAMQVRWNPNFLQGEALLARGDKRKYVFVYGNENELAAISADNVKMQINFDNANCKRFDLRQDRFEQHPFVCGHDQQEAALIKFRHYQTTMLNDYNAWLATRQGYDDLLTLSNYG
jgi:arylsulfatase A-like enzyme